MTPHRTFGDLKEALSWACHAFAAGKANEEPARDPADDAVDGQREAGIDETEGEPEVISPEKLQELLHMRRRDHDLAIADQLANSPWERMRRESVAPGDSGDFSN